MQSFIPHKDNPYVGRKIIGALTIIIFSFAIAYWGQGLLKRPETKAQTEITPALQVNNAQQSTQIQDEDAIDQSKNGGEIIQNQELAQEISESDKLGMTLKEAQQPIPDEPRAKDPKIALTQAKAYARPQIVEGKYIDVSLSHQNMILYEDGKYVDAYLVSTGKASMPTPPGTYHIQNKVPRAFSKRYGLYMPHWMALVPSGEFGIHQLPEWPGGYREGANHLGIPVSHGCVRLGVEPAKRVYDWADIGTTVIVHK